MRERIVNPFLIMALEWRIAFRTARFGQSSQIVSAIEAQAELLAFAAMVAWRMTEKNDRAKDQRGNPKGQDQIR